MSRSYACKNILQRRLSGLDSLSAPVMHELNVSVSQVMNKIFTNVSLLKLRNSMEQIVLFGILKVNRHCSKLLKIFLKISFPSCLKTSLQHWYRLSKFEKRENVSFWWKTSKMSNNQGISLLYCFSPLEVLFSCIISCANQLLVPFQNL